MTSYKKKLLIVGSLLVMLILLVFIGYNSYLQPKLTDIQILNANVAEQQVLIQQLEEQLRDEVRENNHNVDRSTSLQKVLPVTQLTDQFLLDINKAEELANVRILDMYFKYDQPVYEWESYDQNSLEINQIDGSSNNGESEVEVVETMSPMIQGEQVSGLMKQSATLNIKVNTYEHLARFLDELDQLERKVNIESVLFSGDEVEQVFDGVDPILFEVVVSSFYFPRAEELEQEDLIQDFAPNKDRDQPFLE